MRECKNNRYFTNRADNNYIFDLAVYRTLTTTSVCVCVFKSVYRGFTMFATRSQRRATIANRKTEYFDVLKKLFTILAGSYDEFSVF